MTDETRNASLRSLLEYLQAARGFDLSVYKPTTLTRRIEKRLQAVNAADYGGYIDYLEVHPEEFIALFNTILINVTSFFRDAPAWEFLRRELIPRILGNKANDAEIRVWSAGCSSGEEAYSLALSFSDALGLDTFRRRVKIYATDIDEEALVQARQGRYSRKDIEPVPEDLRDAYFEADDKGIVVKADLRRAVVFGRHDLVRDAPISRMDLLVCRNTLMYFNAETQAQVLGRLHFALNDTGYLFLGKAEMALASARLFDPLEMRLRIFSKITSGQPDRPTVPAQSAEARDRGMEMRRALLKEAAFGSSPCAQVVIDEGGLVASINEAARALFDLGARELDQPFQNLELSYRPAELRSLIQKATADRRIMTLKDIPFSPREGAVQYLDIEVRPLFSPDGLPLGVGIGFVDSSSSHLLTLEIQRSRQEQETTNEELQSANEELQTTNEELQSTNEELETTNEELQSTNEEMETMNEELRSTNEELRGANDDLRNRTDELHQVNGFTQSILANVSVAIVAVDPDLKVILWNRSAKNLWGLDADDVRGKPLADLGIGFPVEKIAASIQATLGGGGSRKALLNAVDRRGRPFKCRVTITPSTGINREPLGAVLVMEEE